MGFTRDGCVVVVKRDCPTCELIVPVLHQLVGAQVVTQDDPTFPDTTSATTFIAVDDTELAISWDLDIEFVPTLLRFDNGVETGRTVGWDRAEWERITDVAGLGLDLVDRRVGCGSMTLDPDRVDILRARFEGGRLRSRRIRLAGADDEYGAFIDRGFTDGLPIVPPTETRVLAMLAGTSHSPDEVMAVVAPDLVELTVEKAAINAVMAGCDASYFPWVLAALQAVCTDEFNIHGVLATTMPVGPVLIANGPGTAGIGLNAAGNALGQGWRANMTIGRAVQLVVRNIGGGRPGGVDRATLGNPGKLGLCFAEREWDSPFEPLAVSRGLQNVDAITAFAGEGPRCVVDQLARTADELATTFAHCLIAMHHPKLVLGFDAVLVVSPEHGRLFADAGWDRARLLGELRKRMVRDGAELVRGANGMAEGVPDAFGAMALDKFADDALIVVHAGGDAGLFSAIIGGWVRGAMGSQPVTAEVSTWR